MARTVVGLFKSYEAAEHVKKHLLKEGYSTENVQIAGALLSVVVADGLADKTAELLERHGAQNVDQQRASSGGGQKIDVVEEELAVGKREVVRGGVRVQSHVTERPVEESITLREEHIHVERHPVNRPATSADLAAFKEGAIELTETAEEAVVSKKARVVEEVLVGKEVSEREQTIKDTVRRTDVQVEKIAADKTADTSKTRGAGSTRKS